MDPTLGGNIYNGPQNDGPSNDEHDINDDWSESEDSGTGNPTGPGETKVERMLKRWNTLLYDAFQCYWRLALDGNLQAWRDCHRLYNTAVVVWHGRGVSRDEALITDFRNCLGELREVTRGLGGAGWRMRDERDLLVFAGDAALDAGDLRYRFPVVDPSINLVCSMLSNLGVTTGVGGGDRLREPGQHHQANPATDNDLRPLPGSDGLGNGDVEMVEETVLGDQQADGQQCQGQSGDLEDEEVDMEDGENGDQAQEEEEEDLEEEEGDLRCPWYRTYGGAPCGPRCRRPVWI